CVDLDDPACGVLHEAAKQHPITPQGFYCVLWNPAEDSRHPEDKTKAVAPSLHIGQRVNIPGPCTFALWPRQSAKVIEGHHLRSNQYLLVRVYDEEAARANWSSAIVKPANGPAVDDERDDGVLEVTGDVPEDLSVGRQIIIRGTEVSFYVPPTGVEVVESDEGRYVRDALTLERLEYSILVDEDGNKRYERGPAVVFPRPTEHFYEEDHRDGPARVFRPIELNPIQGIHVKVIAEYTDEVTGRSYSEGEELFITGRDTPIYFPRQEHSLISYDGRSKHFATAVPAGEARYVMERKTGEIRMVKGPTMLLPNPCDEVIVRRALTEQECTLWYPSNSEALEYNRKLGQLATRAPTTRSGAVSEGQVQRSKRRAGGRKKGMRREQGSVMEASHTSSDVSLIAADEFSRGSTFNEPRTLTLMTRFAGVPTINVWTDYAIMVVSRKTGERRVERGPTTVLLAYDETLEVLKLSAGEAAGNQTPLETVYLKVRNNRVTHTLTARTSDHVPVRVRLALRLNFEGDDPSRWFALEDYVGYLCDYMQSVFKAEVRATTVEAFHAQADTLIRNAVLGAQDEDGHRPGTLFEDNGMRLFDLDVLEVVVEDGAIASLLNQARQQTVQSNIELAAARRKLDTERQIEAMVRERASIEAETASHKARLAREQLERELMLNLEQLTAASREHAERLQVQQAKDAVADAGHEASLERKRKNADLDRAVEASLQELRLAQIEAETLATVRRLEAVQEGFSEALLALGNQDTLVKVADALSVQQLLGGRNLPEVVSRVFENTPLDALMRTVQERAVVTHTNGQSGPSTPATTTERDG
ncbi:MAG: hypothetical protein AAFX99_16930, partial [Myxococcota bacterium]